MRAKRRNAHPEHDSQVALFTWARLMEAKYPELALLFAVPNGMRTSMRTAIKAKAEGLKAGVPDVFLPVARKGYHGCAMEFKAEKGRVSPAQEAWLRALWDQGWFSCVVRSTAGAINCVSTYLDIPLLEENIK